MKRFVCAALMGVVAMWAQEPAPPGRGYISQIASGGGWKTTLTLFNPTSSQGQVLILFHADDGSGLSLPLVVTQGGARQTGTGAEVSRTIQPLATLVIETDAPAGSGVVVGWAEVVSYTRITGSAIFSQTGADGRSVEAICPLDYNVLTSMVVPFDNRQGAATGVALVNPTNEQVNLIVRSRNENGIELGQSQLMLPPKGHTAFVMGEQLPGTGGQQGTVEFVSPVASLLTGLGLRFSATGGFTSVPVVHLSVPLATQP
jgi:hypothetical protein